MPDELDFGRPRSQGPADLQNVVIARILFVGEGLLDLIDSCGTPYQVPRLADHGIDSEAFNSLVRVILTGATFDLKV